MFGYLIAIKPLGLMYGSAGAFLSPENLVGRSGAKFPPDASTLSGLFFSVNKAKARSQAERDETHKELNKNLFVAGPFWAKTDDLKFSQDFYIPIPWTKIISQQDGADEWLVKDSNWCRKQDKPDLKPDCHWQIVTSWQHPPQTIRKNKSAVPAPWKYNSILHPRMKDDERHVTSEDGLFLENTVQLPEDISLVYLSTRELPADWYRFGGENHLVEIESYPLQQDHFILELLQQPIQRSFALITPGVWGSKRLSERYPIHPDFPKTAQMLTDKPVPYRFRTGGNLGRGRYAVPAGSVYVLEQPLNKSWWDWHEDWFPKEGYSFKQIGCGLSLPLEIEGVD